TSSPNARSMPNRKLLFYNNIQTHSHSPGNFLPEPGQFFARRASFCPKAAKGQSSRANTKAAKRGNSCIT
ncbi:hypothetical protein, partial [Shewanella algae]|uniref:hypothetical protein n=1 Tax=Shewanella algae TaxID=38313 RepID=UPI001AAD1656